MTARRREESLQKTPVSIAAVSADEISRANVRSIDQLTSVVPGVNFTFGSQKATTIYSIRGMSRVNVGNAQPAVVAYINEVPTPHQGASVPTYDVETIQVVKGPQGTLFGRNTTAGAVLVNTKKPTDELGAWGEVTLGSYNWHAFQGALNIPLVDGKVAVRFATSIERRDGYTKNMSIPGYDMDDRNNSSYRVSLLLKPVDELQNVTVFDSWNSHDRVSNILYSYTPGQLIDRVPFLNGTNLSVSPTATPCGGLPVCSVSAAYARQVAAGPRKTWMEFPVSNDAHVSTVTNTTTLDLGAITVKNIFGYRHVKIRASANTDGWEAAAVEGETYFNISQTSDELQVSGKVLDDKLTFVAGLFYLKAKPSGPNRAIFQQFAQAGVPLSATDSTVIGGFRPLLGATGNAPFYTDTSKAVYGQINYALFDWLSIDAGLRYTKDTTSTCVIAPVFYADRVPELTDCPAANTVNGASNNLTYTFGANWQVKPDVLVYAVTRKGYRAGGVNTPLLGGTLVPFQTFAPETVHDIELGVKSQWRVSDVRGRFNVALFRTLIDGLQASQSTTGSANPALGPDGDGDPSNNPAAVIANFGKGMVRGIEAQVVVSPVRGLELSASGAWIDRKITQLTVQFPSTVLVNNTPEGLYPVAFYGSPDYSYNVGANYRMDLPGDMGELVFDARYSKIGPVPYTAVLAPAYDRLDLNISWNNFLGSKLDATAFVTNLTDSVGVVASSLPSFGIGFNTVNYQEPRMFGVKLRYAFGGEAR